MNCPYCHQPAQFLSSKEYYGTDYGTNLYLCRPCDALVGTHGKGKTPVGTMANGSLRKWRIAAHSIFDPMWKGRKKCMSRSGAYLWMQEVMGLPATEAHIGMFDEEKCKMLIEHVKRKRFPDSHK